MSRAPDRRADTPKSKMVEKRGKPAWFRAKQVRDRFGKLQIVEADGYDRKKQRPATGVYRKCELSTDPVADIRARMDYCLWLDALAEFQERLANRLADHRTAQFEYVKIPWKSELMMPV